MLANHVAIRCGACKWDWVGYGREEGPKNFSLDGEDGGCGRHSRDTQWTTYVIREHVAV